MTTDITMRAAGAAPARDRSHVAAERIDQAELECLLLDPTEPDSSLAGNSESALFGLVTTDVAGLHFAGAFRDTNYAVAADIVGAALARTRVRASASGIPAAGGEEGPPISAANADTSRLHATAYVLTHGPLIRDLTETAFVFGEHESYQVPITLVEEATRLDFGVLRTFDPMSMAVAAEGPTANRARTGGPADLMLDVIWNREAPPCPLRLS